MAVIDAKSSAGEEGNGLVGASPIGASVDPPPARGRVGVVSEMVAVGPFGGWSGDGLRGVSRELRL